MRLKPSRQGRTFCSRKARSAWLFQPGGLAPGVCGWYAVLLLFESVILLGMGLGARSRSYVLVEVASLILNGLAQFQPAFGELPRFVQIGLIGTTLLGGDLVALLLRERIIDVGRGLRLRWREWGP